MMTIRRDPGYLIANNQLPSPVLIVYQHLNQFVFNCLLLLSLTYSVQSELNSTKLLIKSTTPNSLSDSDSEFSTSYDFLNPIDLVNNSSSITEPPTIVVDLSTETIKGDNSTDHLDRNETIRPTIKSTITTTISPNHVTLFLDGDDELNTLPGITIKSDGNNLTDSDGINTNEIINSSSSSSTINPNVISKSPTLPNTIKNHETTPTINSNQSSPSDLIESESTTTLTIDMNDPYQDNLTTISPLNNETITRSSPSTNLTTGNETICESNKQITDPNYSRLTIDHYEAKKFFLFTMILLAICCLLILIVLILVVYIFRKLTRERTVKIPQTNNNNHFNHGGGSIEFDTIKDGRFYQWQANVNSGFDSADLNESTTQSTGYRFLEGSVVPFNDRYQNEIKSTETFGHHQSNHQLNQPSLSTSSVNSLPKSTITTVDTRL